MSMQIEIRLERDYLKVVATGKFSLKVAERHFLEILEAIVLHKARKALIDGRALIGKPATIERFCYGKFAANSVKMYHARGLYPFTKFAYVLIHPVLDPQRFGETVAVNRGMRIKAFDNPEEAFAWLELAPAHHPDAASPS
ncbi:MAG: hypothetical protein ABI547_04710 [Betaproteobacteria bacterium]